MTHPAIARADRLDWRSLEHAHGPAGDTAALLRLAADPAPGTCEQGVADLRARLCPHGTPYTATAAAVTFLLELAADPRIRARTALLDLLALIAGAHGAAEPILTEVRTAFARGHDLLAALAADPDAGVRRGTARLLGAVRAPGPAATEAVAADVLTERLAAEADPAVRAALVDALQGSGTADTLAHRLLTGTDTPQGRAAARAAYRVCAEIPSERPRLGPALARGLTAADPPTVRIAAVAAAQLPGTARRHADDLAALVERGPGPSGDAQDAFWKSAQALAAIGDPRWAAPVAGALGAHRFPRTVHDAPPESTIRPGLLPYHPDLVEPAARAWARFGSRADLPRGDAWDAYRWLERQAGAWGPEAVLAAARALERSGARRRALPTDGLARAAPAAAHLAPELARIAQDTGWQADDRVECALAAQAAAAPGRYHDLLERVLEDGLAYKLVEVAERAARLGVDRDFLTWKLRKTCRTAFRYDESELAVDAAEVLHRATGETQVPLEVAHRCLRGTATDHRAVDLAGHLGPAARELVPAVRRHLDAPGDHGRRAALALYRVTGERGPLLARLLGRPEPWWPDGRLAEAAAALAPDPAVTAHLRGLRDRDRTLAPDAPWSEALAEDDRRRALLDGVLDGVGGPLPAPDGPGTEDTAGPPEPPRRP